MGQKANPIGNRLGIIRGWDSNWYADKDYGLKVVEDEKIRNYLRARRPKTATADPRERNKPVQQGISRVAIERTMRRVTVTIHTSRPGIIIGKGGKEVDLIKEELKVLTGKEVQINIFEIRKPSWTPILLVNRSPSKSKLVSTTVAQSRPQFRARCVPAVRESKCASVAVWPVPRSPVQKNTRRAVRHCIRSVPI